MNNLINIAEFKGNTYPTFHNFIRNFRLNFDLTPGRYFDSIDLLTLSMIAAFSYAGISDGSDRFKPYFTLELDSIWDDIRSQSVQSILTLKNILENYQPETGSRYLTDYIRRPSAQGCSLTSQLSHTLLSGYRSDPEVQGTYFEIDLNNPDSIRDMCLFNHPLYKEI